MLIVIVQGECYAMMWIISGESVSLVMNVTTVRMALTQHVDHADEDTQREKKGHVSVSVQTVSLYHLSLFGFFI